MLQIKWNREIGWDEANFDWEVNKSLIQNFGFSISNQVPHI